MHIYNKTIKKLKIPAFSDVFLTEKKSKYKTF